MCPPTKVEDNRLKQTTLQGFPGVTKHFCFYLVRHLFLGKDLIVMNAIDYLFVL